MTNKTIALDHAVAERLVSAVDNGALFRPDDLDTLRAALAEPVPPAGGEVEVLAYLAAPLKGSRLFYLPSKNIEIDASDVALVDRTHVTRLQAEVMRLKSSAESWEPIHDDDLTKAETFLSTRLKDAMFFPVHAHELANIAMHCIREVRATRAELTKARELWATEHAIKEQPGEDVLWQVLDAAVGVLTRRAAPHAWESEAFEAGRKIIMARREGLIATAPNQSAPADKGQGEPVAWMALNSNGFPQKCLPSDPQGFPVYRHPAEQPAPVAVPYVQNPRSLLSDPHCPECGHPDCNGQCFGDDMMGGFVMSKYDEVLRPFLAMMEKELHANAGKGDRPGWLQMDSKTAILEVFYHMGKLHQAVHRGEAEAIQEYAADVANMCMMLVDVCGLLPVDEQSLLAAQARGEPVAWQFYQDGKWWNGNDRIQDHLQNTIDAGFKVRNLYAEQTAPVAVVLPERRAQDGWQSLTSQDLDWNACLDEVARLNGVK